jgi:KEOPS complex subunit Cgi121
MDPWIASYHAKVSDVKSLLAAMPGATQLVRADRIYGADHLRLAGTLAARAIAEGRPRSADLPTETLLYAAGERQVGKALSFLGIADGARTVAVVSWDPAAFRAFAAREGWREDPALIAGGAHVLDAFGVSDVERAMLPQARWDELIFERVALTDVLKA